MKVYLATDHAGFKLKEEIKEYLLSKNYEVVDEGAFEFDPNDDYPDFIAKAAKKTSEDVNAKAVIFGKSGAGEAIVANKFKNIRAVLGFSENNVRLSREHNDANVLSFGSEFIDLEKTKELTDIFLNTPFSNEEKHKRRIEEIKNLENDTLK